MTMPSARPRPLGAQAVLVDSAVRDQDRERHRGRGREAVARVDAHLDVGRGEHLERRSLGGI